MEISKAFGGESKSRETRVEELQEKQNVVEDKLKEMGDYLDRYEHLWHHGEKGFEEIDALELQVKNKLGEMKNKLIAEVNQYQVEINKLQQELHTLPHQVDLHMFIRITVERSSYGHSWAPIEETEAMPKEYFHAGNYEPGVAYLTCKFNTKSGVNPTRLEESKYMGEVYKDYLEGNWPKSSEEAKIKYFKETHLPKIKQLFDDSDR